MQGWAAVVHVWDSALGARGRALLPKASRLLTEITIGRGDPSSHQGTESRGQAGTGPVGSETGVEASPGRRRTEPPPDLETTEVCDRANKSPAGGPGVPLLLGALHLSGSSNIAAPHAVPTWGVPRLPLPLPFTPMAGALPPREGSPPLTPSRLPQDPSLGGTPVLFPELSRRSHCTVAACIRAGAAPNCRLPTSTRCHP